MGGRNIDASSIQQDAWPLEPDSVCTSGSTVHVQPAAKKKWIIYLIGSLALTVIAMNVSSTWSYLQMIDPGVSPNFLGWANFGFNAIAVITDLVFGKWMHATASSKGPLVALYLLLALSVLLYIYSVSVGGQAGLYQILVARLILGSQRGAVTISRTLVSVSSSVEERSQAMATLVLANTFGYWVGSGFQAAVAQLGSRSFYISPIKLHLNLYTIPSCLVLLIVVPMIILVYRYIGPFPKQSEVSTGSPQEKDSFKEDSLVKASLVFLFLLSNFSVSVSETLIIPYIQHQFALTKSEAVWYGGLLLTMMAVIGFLQQANLKFLLKKFTDRKLILIGYFCVCLGFVLVIPFGNFSNDDVPPTNATAVIDSSRDTNEGCPRSYHWCKSAAKIWLPQLICGAILHASGFSFCLSLVVSVYSKVLSSSNLGRGVSFLSAAGNVGRLIAPMASAASYVEVGPQFTYLWMFLFLSTGLVFYALMYNRIGENDSVPAKDASSAEEDEERSHLQPFYVTPV